MNTMKREVPEEWVPRLPFKLDDLVIFPGEAGWYAGDRI